FFLLLGNSAIAMAYEEARKLRLQENHKRFQDLGISQISKTLTQITKKTPQ
ncbi:unnamed protein product, partial [Arabidopsis halleri]